MENQIEVENQQHKPSQPSSQSCSPTHEFSFSISHNTFNESFLNSNNKSKSSSPNSFTALDLSPADVIFFNGHLLPLQILSNFPSSISPRASTNSMDSFTLPIRELFSEEEDDENFATKESKIKNMEPSKKVEGNLTPRNKQELMKSWKLGQYSSAPASMRTSPSNSGVLFPTTPLTPVSDSSMEELQNAIQAAIAHCKNSYSKDEILNC
ncbi:unnamed protein product [Vicia faba]|uniref:Uncharacterized protein n=1 Tax=Vicia faba TaxID=3906 RepID=A0AAV1A6M4_VICFA|nr:unnamed protein product [Vicia faba]